MTNEIKENHIADISKKVQDCEYKQLQALKEENKRLRAALEEIIEVEKECKSYEEQCPERCSMFIDHSASGCNKTEYILNTAKQALQAEKEVGE